MMVLTLIVWTLMYVRRIRFMLSAGINPQKLTTREKLIDIVPEEVNYPANNLKNLFELPVLFYALCVYFYATSSVDMIVITTAWAFVVFRALHSLVHCTINHVMTRFRLYLVSALALWFLLVLAAFRLIW